MLPPSPVPKRHHLCCRYQGRPGDKHRVHRTPWRRPHPLPGPGMPLPGHRGQEPGLSPGFAGWQMIWAGSVMQSGCHWGIKTGIKTAVPGEGGHRGAPTAPGNGSPAGLPTCFYRPRVRCGATRDRPGAPAAGEAPAAPAPLLTPGTARTRCRPRPDSPGAAPPRPDGGRSPGGTAGTGAASPGPAGAQPAAVGGFLLPPSPPGLQLRQ